MAQKKEELPVNADVDLQNGGTITYANEVISTIAGVAANEIDGIAGMCISGGLSDIIGRNRNVTRGVKVDIGSEEASFDLYVIVEYGQPIQKVCHDVQENVRKAIESMTGLHVVRVDVHVQGVSFEKEKQQSEMNIEAAKGPALTAGSGAKAPAEGKGQKNAKKTRKKDSDAILKAPEASPAPAAAEETLPEDDTETVSKDGNVSVDAPDEEPPAEEAKSPEGENAADGDKDAPDGTGAEESAAAEEQTEGSPAGEKKTAGRKKNK